MAQDIMLRYTRHDLGEQVAAMCRQRFSKHILCCGLNCVVSGGFPAAASPAAIGYNCHTLVIHAGGADHVQAPS